MKQRIAFDKKQATGENLIHVANEKVDVQV